MGRRGRPEAESVCRRGQWDAGALNLVAKHASDMAQGSAGLGDGCMCPVRKGVEAQGPLGLWFEQPGRRLAFTKTRNPKAGAVRGEVSVRRL